MDKVLQFVQNVSFLLAVVGVTGLFILMLNGCQMYRGPGGEVGIGIPIGVLIETSEQALIAGVGAIPGVGPLIQSFLVPAVAGGFTVAGAAKAGRMALEKKRKASDRAREELRVENERLKAELAAKEA